MALMKTLKTLKTLPSWKKTIPNLFNNYFNHYHYCYQIHFCLCPPNIIHDFLVRGGMVFTMTALSVVTPGVASLIFSVIIKILTYCVLPAAPAVSTYFVLFCLFVFVSGANTLTIQYSKRVRELAIFTNSRTRLALALFW